MLGTALWRQIFPHPAAEYHEARVVSRTGTRRHEGQRRVQGGVKFCLAADAARHQPAGVDGDDHRLVALDLVLAGGEL